MQAIVARPAASAIGRRVIIRSGLRSYSGSRNSMIMQSVGDAESAKRRELRNVLHDPQDFEQEESSTSPAAGT